MYIFYKIYLQWIYWTLFFIACCSTIFASELLEDLNWAHPFPRVLRYKRVIEIIEGVITEVREYKYSFILRYPPYINIWLVLQLSYTQIGFLISLLMLIIDTHAFTYIPVQHDWSNVQGCIFWIYHYIR